MRNFTIFDALRGEKEPPTHLPLYRMPWRDKADEVKSNTTSDAAADAHNGFYDEKNWDANGTYIGPGTNDAGIKSTVLNKDKEFMFIYGTLKKGGQRESLLQTCEFLGPAITGINYDLRRTGTKSGQYDFPILFKNNKFVKGRIYLSRVVGELYLVDPATLAILDNIEAVPKMFIRDKITVYKYDPEKNHIKDQVVAATYLGNQDYWANTNLHPCTPIGEKSPHLYFPVSKGIVT